MTSIMKRSLAVVVGGALLALSASAAAADALPRSSAVKLSDAELDRITAGAGAISQVLIFNPGKAEFLKTNGRPGAELPSHATCVNCFDLEVPRTSGAMAVLLPDGKIVTHFIRQSPF